MVKYTFENYVEIFFILILLYFIIFVKSFSFGKSNLSKSIIKVFLLLCLIYFLYISPFAGIIFGFWLLKFMFYDQKQSEFFENLKISEISKYDTIEQSELDKINPKSIVNIKMPSEIKNIASKFYTDNENELEDTGDIYSQDTGNTYPQDTGDTYPQDYNNFNSYSSNQQSETELNNQQNNAIETMEVFAESEEVDPSSGCTYSSATNFDPNAVIDDGSCVFNTVSNTTNNVQGYSGKAPYSIKCEYSYLQTI